MKTTEKIRIDTENDFALEIGVVRCKRENVKQNKACIQIRYKQWPEGITSITEEQLQDLLNGLTIVQNELHKRNSSKRQKKKKPAPKPKKEIEVQMFLVNPIPIL